MSNFVGEFNLADILRADAMKVTPRGGRLHGLPSAQIKPDLSQGKKIARGIGGLTIKSFGRSKFPGHSRMSGIAIGQAKIEQASASGSIEQNIMWAEVAVKNAL